jgi:hypothetical protein
MIQMARRRIGVFMGARMPFAARKSKQIAFEYPSRFVKFENLFFWSKKNFDVTQMGDAALMG